MVGVAIRPLAAGDRADWRRLWTAYLAFYGTTVPDAVYDSTFARLLGDQPYDPDGLIAIDLAGRAIGLVHYLQHRHCWRQENVTYLQDLFVDAAARGTGAGRALIEAVYAEADRRGCPMVYWMTQDFNDTARRLYDRVATKTPFIKYQR